MVVPIVLRLHLMVIFTPGGWESMVDSDMEITQHNSNQNRLGLYAVLISNTSLNKPEFRKSTPLPVMFSKAFLLRVTSSWVKGYRKLDACEIFFFRINSVV